MQGRVTDVDGTPIVGRLVSNGLDVTTSDSEGRWLLPDRPRPFVWVHRGDGFDCAEWYRPIQPFDAGEVVFEMSPSPRRRRRFAQITDLHIDDSDGAMQVHRGDCTAAVLGAVFDELTGFGCDFVLATGDLTNRGTDEDFAEIARALDVAPLPVFHMPGNHDHYGDLFTARDEHRDEHDGIGDSLPSGRRYEARLGPRWWSISEAGLWIVAIDWHTWVHGVDDEAQRTWLAADLARAEPGTKVLLLSHDLMSNPFFDELAELAPHVTLVGSLSGHWHTVRSARVGGQRHLNTGNPMFGSWDWSPPHCRLLELSGAELLVETRALGVAEEARTATFVARPVTSSCAPAEAANWRSALDGVAHLGGPIIVAGPDGDDLAVVGWRDEDLGVGGVSALRTADGTIVWTARTDAPVLGSVGSHDGVVAAVTVDGRLTLFDASTGATVWSTVLASDRGLWLCNRPLLTDDAVVIGSGPAHGGFDRHDGHPLWVRTDLGSHEMYPTYGDGLVHGRSVILGMPSMQPSLYSLDAATGETNWAVGASWGASPAGSLTWGGAGSLYGLSHAPELFCIDPDSGQERFRVAIEQPYTWAAPLATDLGVVVNAGNGHLACHDPDDGSTIWELAAEALPGPAPAYRPYGQPGPSSITSPVLWGANRSVVAATDGSVRVIDLGAGSVEQIVRLPAAVTAQIAIWNDDAIVPTVDGSVWSIRLV